MEFTNQFIFFTGLLLTVSVLASVLADRSGVPLLLVFLILGMLAGENGPGGIEFDDFQGAHLVGSLALAVILFDGGLHTPASSFRVGLRPALVLATLGVLVTAAVTALVAAWVFELNWINALLMGAIVGSTDAAAVFYLLHSRGLDLQSRVRSTLEIESGANDPMAVFLTIALIELLTEGSSQPGLSLLLDFIRQMGLGALLGVGGGLLLTRLINRLTLADSLYPLLALSGALLIFGAAASVGGSGFLAAYLAGLLVGNRTRRANRSVRRFHDGMAWLCQIGMFLMLGLLVTPMELLPVAPQALLVALALILLARPLAVFLCLAPFRFPWREQLFIGWVGLRGAVPIILGVFPLLAGLPDARTDFNVAFFVVLVSLLIQGWTVAPMARLLGLQVPSGHDRAQRESLELPELPERELVIYRVPPGCAAVGLHPGDLPLPADVERLAVIRDGRRLPTGVEKRLQDGDQLYLMARHAQLADMDEWFTRETQRSWQQRRRYFGEFVIGGDARLTELALVYGLRLPPDVRPDETVSERLQRRFHRRVIVGDRLKLAGIELVVQAVQDGQITRVGLKLGH